MVTERENNAGKRISIVIPVYNVEGYLRSCVDSVLSQSYGNFELILVNDGSKDASPAICDEYAKADSRVVVIHKENEGPSKTRNRGIEEARGDYLMFVDSDDLLVEGALEKMAGAMERSGAELCICGYERFRGDWTLPSSLTTEPLQIFKDRKELAAVYNQPKTNMFGVSIWAKLYRLDIIREHNIRFDTNISYEEDCVFNLDYFRHVNTTAVLPDVFYRWRQMDVSLSKGYRKGTFQFLVNGFRGRKKFLKEQGMKVNGANGVFLVVIKTTLMKIYDSKLPKQEKFAEYEMVMSYPECITICKDSVNSKVKLTRELATAVANHDAKAIHSALQRNSITEKVKRVAKKILGRALQ